MVVIIELHTLAALLPRKQPRYPLYSRLSEFRRENIFHLPIIEPRFLGIPTCSLISIPIELSQLHNSRGTENKNPFLCPSIKARKRIWRELETRLQAFINSTLYGCK
jgi:hypothetical protein